MYLTGFADEAGADIETQIRATRELGWSNIEARGIDGANLHDLPEEKFNAVCDRLDAEGIRVNCFGSGIANWACSVEDPFERTIETIERCIPRMHRLGSKLIRVMSYKLLEGRGPEDQMEEERFRRMREIRQRFADAGITAVHENCGNYGGMGWTYTLRMIENVPGLKLVFDTGNPTTTPDYIKPEPRPRQSSWEFYRNVRDHVVYVHIKDVKLNADGPSPCTWPGEGDSDVQRILKDLHDRGYDGGISIEPHMAMLYHDPSYKTDADKKYGVYLEYGRRLEKLAREIGFRPE